MSEQDGFTLKEIMLRMEKNLDDYITESRSKDKDQDSEISKLRSRLDKQSAWSGVWGTLGGILSSFGHQIFKS